MKLVALTSAALLAATTAFAGNPGYVAPADDTVAPAGEVAPSNTGSLGGSAGWLVPVVAIVLIAAAVAAATKDDDEE